MKREDYLSWDEYFMGIALLSAGRSKDPNSQVGACIVDNDNKIVSLGYNGAPKGLHHCIDAGGCLRKLNKIESGTRQEICRAVHAEQNAIISAAVKGVSIKGGTIYINTYPCSICTRMLINAEIKILYSDVVLNFFKKPKSESLTGKKFFFKT